MNTKSSEIIYSQVYAILQLMSKEYIAKIPKKLYGVIENERDESYNPNYNLQEPFINQNISKDAMAMIALIYYSYLCNTQEDKARINKILIQNEQKHQEELKEKYNPDLLFKKKENKIEFEQESQETRMIVIENKNIFQKIWHFIKNKLGKNNSF